VCSKRIAVVPRGCVLDAIGTGSYAKRASQRYKEIEGERFERGEEEKWEGEIEV